MTTVGGSLLKAMRRPALVTLIFGFRLLFALTIAWPLSQVLSPAYVMSQPQSEQSLFEPGAVLLLRLVSENRDVLLQILQMDIWIFTVAVLIGTILSTYILDSLQAPAGWRRMLHNVPRQVGIVVSYWVGVVAAALLAKVLLSFVPALVYPWFGEKGADLTIAGLLGLLVLTFFALRLVCDLTRASALKSSASLTVICGRVLGDLGRRSPFWLRIVASWALLIVPVPMLVQLWLPAYANSAILVCGLTVVHQSAVFAMCALQLGWWVFAVDNAPVVSKHES